jgi:hypothetical protein
MSSWGLNLGWANLTPQETLPAKLYSIRAAVDLASWQGNSSRGSSPWRLHVQSNCWGGLQGTGSEASMQLDLHRKQQWIHSAMLNMRYFLHFKLLTLSYVKVIFEEVYKNINLYNQTDFIKSVIKYIYLVLYILLYFSVNLIKIKRIKLKWLIILKRLL